MSLIQVSRLRASRGTREDVGAVVIVAFLLVASVLVSVLPYRLLFHRDFERINYDGTRCYIIGQSVYELLTYCPDTSPPRNHIIKRDDPAIKRLGIVETIFSKRRD
jgi:hypothetical protein